MNLFVENIKLEEAFNKEYNLFFSSFLKDYIKIDDALKNGDITEEEIIEKIKNKEDKYILYAMYTHKGMFGNIFVQLKYVFENSSSAFFDYLTRVFEAYKNATFDMFDASKRSDSGTFEAFMQYSVLQVTSYIKKTLSQEKKNLFSKYSSKDALKNVVSLDASTDDSDSLMSTLKGKKGTDKLLLTDLKNIWDKNIKSWVLNNKIIKSCLTDALSNKDKTLPQIAEENNISVYSLKSQLEDFKDLLLQNNITANEFEMLQKYYDVELLGETFTDDNSISVAKTSKKIKSIYDFKNTQEFLKEYFDTEGYDKKYSDFLKDTAWYRASDGKINIHRFGATKSKLKGLK